MTNANPDHAEVFISYSSRDADRVLQIAAQIEAAGIRVWVDRHDILGGTNYGYEIVRAIKNCRVMALMCSDASLRSPNVGQEVRLAWKHQKPLLPLQLAPTNIPEQIEYWLEGCQWIEVLNHPPERWLPRVLQALWYLEGQGSPYALYGPRATGRDLGAAARTNLTKASAAPIIGPAEGLAGLRAIAKFTDRIWPLPDYARPAAATAPRASAVRDLGAAQDQARHRYRLGSRVCLAIESERQGYLTLLDEGPTGTSYCLCPSWFAPDVRLYAGRSYLPQAGSRYAFEVTGQPGREHLLAIITDESLGLDWLPPEPSAPARVLDRADVDAILDRLRGLEANRWTALATYFDVAAN